MVLKIQVLTILRLLISWYLEPLCDDLCWAKKRGDLKRVEHHLSIGLSPDAVDGLVKREPLHHASSLDRPEMIQMLLKHDTSIEITDNDKRTPLGFAASKYRTEVAQLLPKENSYIEATENYSRTPLHYGRFALFFGLWAGNQPRQLLGF